MHRVGLLLFEDVDLLDVGGPYEVVLTANRLAERRGEPVPFDVVTLGVAAGPVTAYGGLGLVPADTLDAAGDLDVLVVPGAVDIAAVRGRDDLVAAIRRADERADVTTSVCTGALLLADAGVLEDVAAATTHHEDLPLLAEAIGPRAHVARWVDAGAVVTAGGLSSGIAMALHLVDRLAGRDLAIATAAQLAYDWNPDDGISG